MKGRRLGGESDDTLPFLFINNHMKSFKEILEEAKQINYSSLSMKDIDKHHGQLSPEEKSRFSDMVDPESSVPVITQQRNALKTIHDDRKKSV